MTMVTREHTGTQFEHHLMEREAAMAPKLDEYLQSFVKLQQQNETDKANISRTEPRVQEMADEGEASPHRAKMLDLRMQLVKAKEKLQAMVKLKASLEEDVEGLKLKVEMSATQARKCALAEAEKHAAVLSLRERVVQLDAEIEAIGGEINVDDGEATGTRFAVLKETLRDEKALGARLTKQLAGARESLCTSKRTPKEAYKALKLALEEAKAKVTEEAKRTDEAKPSESASTEVWDGQPGTRAPHLAAIRDTGKALLEQVALQLERAKKVACRPGPRGISRKISISELTSMLATREARQVRLEDEVARRKVELPDDEW